MENMPSCGITIDILRILCYNFIMSGDQVSTAERVPDAEWLAYSPGDRQGSFRFNVDDIGALATLHYDHGTAAEAPGVRLASFVHLGGGSSNIDMQPDSEGWVFHASRLGRQEVSLARLAGVTKAILENTDPMLDPVTKGVKVLDGNVHVHPNQTDLLERFEDYIIYEDAQALVINKPPHVSAHWDRYHHIGAAEIAQKWRGADIAPVHRLDRLTSGVLLLGKSLQARRHLSQQFSRKTPSDLQKIYIAIIRGGFDGDQSIRCFLEEDEDGKMIANGHGLSGKLAKTTLTRLASLATASGEVQSVLGIEILTGRKHQIRASLSKIGKPIVDDPLYSGRPLNGRMRLHARSLTFTHPRSGQPIELSAPLPPDFFSDMGAGERASVEQAASVFRV